MSSPLTIAGTPLKRHTQNRSLHEKVENFLIFSICHPRAYVKNARRHERSPVRASSGGHRFSEESDSMVRFCQFSAKPFNTHGVVKFSATCPKHTWSPKQRIRSLKSVFVSGQMPKTENLTTYMCLPSPSTKSVLTFHITELNHFCNHSPSKTG